MPMDGGANALPAPYYDENNSSPLLGICIFFLIFETLLICLLWTSRYLAKEQKVNLSMSILMTAGYCTCVAKITLGILMVKIGGAGRHMPTLSSTTVTHMLKLTTALQILCPATTSLTKLGILSLLNQILGRVSKTSRFVIRATFALVLMILIVQIIIPFANCKPFSATWSANPSSSSSCAFPGLNLWRYLSVPNVLTTVIMIIIPLPALYKLQVGRAMKIGLGLVFCVCILGVVAAIMRFYSFLVVKDFHDITYEAVQPLCWTIAESGIYLTAGVLPTLKPLVRKVAGTGRFDKLLNRTSWGSGNQNNRRAEQMLLDGEKVLGSQTSEVEIKSDESRKTSRNEDVKE